MMRRLDRRGFLTTSAGLALASALPLHADDKAKKPLFLISLAQWSLHKAFFARKLDPLDFPVIAKKDYDIDAVEYVNQFYKGKAKDEKYAAELKKRADDNGVKSVLIMCDGEGALGDPDEKKRNQAVENHYKWVELAKFLGCHSIRVNAETGQGGTEQEKMGRAADCLRKLTEFGAKHEINVIVENHGGLSSNGEWLAGVMRKVDHPRCGTLPDFGNFYGFDRYKGVELMMPFAKGVSAKSYDFDDKGNETTIDYQRMMKIVLAAGYHGRVGIEYEGNKLSEPDGIRATKRLLERLRTELAG
jgi:sugar phosphate isomerase/epimerase